MKIRISSDFHADINRNIPKLSGDVDCDLIAGDIAGSLQSTDEFLLDYFYNSPVYFINGNHFVYNNENKTIPHLIKEYKMNFPINIGKHHFLENQWCWLDKEHSIALIGCIFWTDYKYHDYKEFHIMMDEQGRRLDKNGNLLPEDPTKTEEFQNKIRAIWNDETTDYHEKDKLFKELYHSVSPDNNERVDTSFKNRVSEEVYNNYIAWIESQGKEGKKEYSQKDYIYLNQRIANHSMNDFRYGKMPDSEGYRYINPDDCLKFHKDSKKFVKKAYKEIISENPDAKIILMTHHPLSPKAISEQYRRSELNAAFVSDLEKWIDQFDRIKLIVSGHVHNQKIFNIGKNIIKYICNPYGYELYNEQIDFSNNLIIDTGEL